MSNRFGRQHAALPYCLRALSENQPRNYHEFMVRKCMLPAELEVYMDNKNRFLYDTKSMAQELEELKASKRASLDYVTRQTEQIKRYLVGDMPAADVDVECMKKRLMRAHLAHAKAAGDHLKQSTNSSSMGKTSGLMSSSNHKGKKWN